ncbi:hypothetical protein [Maribacter sp.]|uniref:hypothetical protein n=1 Tax=Maribacter sp. TaxID=1897614 RepID=UPI0025C1B5C0|nr:hypothetical protein [Maribacter sp.]
MSTTKKKTKRCPCGNTNISRFCHKCSKYKLVFLLINDQGKEFSAKTGRLANPARYNFVKDNKLSVQEVAYKMLERFKKTTKESTLLANSRKIIIYSNPNGQPLLNMDV